MDILINIPDASKAEWFLEQVAKDGWFYTAYDYEAVYIADAAEVSRNDESTNTSGDRGATGKVSYSKPSPY